MRLIDLRSVINSYIFLPEKCTLHDLLLSDIIPRKLNFAVNSPGLNIHLI